MQYIPQQLLPTLPRTLLSTKTPASVLSTFSSPAFTELTTITPH